MPALVSLLLLGCALRTPRPLALRGELLPEGLLVEDLPARSPPARDGLVPGDLIVRVGDAPPAGALRGRGEVELVVRAPLSGEYREVLTRYGGRRGPARPPDRPVALAMQGPAPAWQPDGPFLARPGPDGLSPLPGARPALEPRPLLLAPEAPLAMSFPRLDGGQEPLAAPDGRPTLLAFFATWCAPCVPEMIELHRRVAADPQGHPRVLAVSVDEAAERPAVEAWAARMDLPFPVVLAPEAAETFGLGGLPALRLFDGQGRLLWASRGYHEGALDRMDHWLRQAGPAPGRLVGWSFGLPGARLVGFQAGAGRATLAALGAGETGALEGSTGERGTGERGTGERGTTGSLDSEVGVADDSLLAWLGGPVEARAGGRWLRARSPSGRSRWLLTTPEPIRALAADEERIFLAIEGGLLVLDSQGRLLWRREEAVVALAADGEGGVWAVDGASRLHLDPEGAERTRAPGALGVDGRGLVFDERVRALLPWRPGPEAAPWTVLQRADGAVLLLDPEGAARGQLFLEEAPPRLGVADLEGDGRDELLLLVPGQGLLVLAP